MRRGQRGMWTAGGLGLLVVVAGVLTWVRWPSSEEPRARVYRDATACLLTDERGVTAPEAAPVWAGMQDASARTHGQVRFLSVTGAQTAKNAESFAGTLVLGRCGVILAGPGIAADAVRTVAAQQPQQRFVLVGGPASTLGNVTVVEASKVSTVVAETLST